MRTTYEELVKSMADCTLVTQATADAVLKELRRQVATRVLEGGDDVVIPHFGRFTKKVHPARKLFGGKIEAKERVSVKFVPYI